MNRILGLLLPILACASAPPAPDGPPEPGPAREVAFPTPIQTMLDNGLRVLFVRWTAAPVVSIRLELPAGSRLDPPSRTGLASLVADLLKEGAAGRSSAQIAGEIESLGAEIGAEAGRDSISVTAAALNSQFDAVSGLLADVVLRPDFPRDEMEKARERAISELLLNEGRPQYLASRLFNSLLYGSGPYGRYPTAEALSAVSRDEVVQFHRKRFVPGGATLVVVGDVTPAAVVSMAQARFAAWQGSAAPEENCPPPVEPDRRAVHLIDRPGSVQSTIVAGRPAVPLNSPEALDLVVAEQVLGGGASSRLFNELREKRGLTYGAYSMLRANALAGGTIASADVRTGVTAEALSALLEQLDSMAATAPPDDEVAAARSFLAGSFPMEMETPSAIAERLAMLATYRLPSDYWTTYRGRIGSVTPEAVLAVSRSHVKGSGLFIVVVGDASAVKEPLSRSFEVVLHEAEKKSD